MFDRVLNRPLVKKIINGSFKQILKKISKLGLKTIPTGSLLFNHGFVLYLTIFLKVETKMLQ